MCFRGDTAFSNALEKHGLQCYFRVLVGYFTVFEGHFAIGKSIFVIFFLALLNIFLMAVLVAAGENCPYIQYSVHCILQYMMLYVARVHTGQCAGSLQQTL